MDKKNVRFGLLETILFYFRCVPGVTLLMYLLKILLSLLPFLSVMAGAQFIDRALAVASIGMKPAVISVFIMVVIQLVQALGNNLYSFLRVLQRGKAYSAIDKVITEKIAHMQYSYVEEDAVQDILSRISGDPEGMLSGIIEGYLELGGFLLSNVSLIILLVMQSPMWVSAILVIMLVLFGCFAVKGGEKQYNARREVTVHRRKAAYYEEMLGSRAMVNERTLFGYSEEINGRFMEENHKARRKERKARLWWFVGMNAGGYLAIGISVIVIIALLPPVLHGRTSIGIFVSLVSAFLSMTQSITWQFPGIIKNLAQGRLVLKDFETVLNIPSYDSKKDSEKRDAVSFESLEFRNVSFKYPNTDREILKDISFRIEKGGHYAFAGKNGCGKSTVVKLIMGLYEPDEGVILLNGKDRRLYDAEQIWQVFSVLFQDYARYPVSLYDNIALGMRGAECSRDEVCRAAAAAGLDQLIGRLPHGLDTDLGRVLEDSADLSGGEWQRVAMARASCGKANVKILDEPTASMDPVQEQNVYLQFSRMHQDTTTIMITHRLGATLSCECIFVINDGVVAEEGSHDALMEKNGLYRMMYDRQREWYL